ncbi:MAG: MazG nucleotide pyrophosphohydrolase domain-containing protein [Myxococcota bacterium]
MSADEPGPITLPRDASMAAYQMYIRELEAMHGWLDVDLVHNCFLMGEEVGELFKAIRKVNRYYIEEREDGPATDRVSDVAEEIVDVFNYLLAIANRLNIDLEAAFRAKNQRNQLRTWNDQAPGSD